VKAFVNTEYGSPDVLRLVEMETPAPDPDGVLLRIHAASVNALDWRMLRGTPYAARPMMGGILRPKSTFRGRDVAGTVEAVGTDVTDLKPGDEVFGVCGGAFADYATAAPENLAPKPGWLTFEQAAAIPIAGVTALQALRDRGRVQAGENVLVNGAAGGVGTFTVQVAKALGADVTAVCSTRNVDLVRSLGADRVLDYTAEDFVRDGVRHDLIVDNVSSRSLRALRRVLTPKGRLVVVGGHGDVLGPLWRWATVYALDKIVSNDLIVFVADVNRDDLLFLAGLAEDGRLTPAIERTYPLAEVPEAVRYVETGHARAKIVVTP
jgi:NADPH:quinone reductase-like Zn-dependent oxidoreductase